MSNLDEALRILDQDYIFWSFDTISSKELKLPILKLNEVQIPGGEKKIRIDMFSDTMTENFMGSMGLDINTPAEEIVKIVKDLIDNDAWTEDPEYFITGNRGINSSMILPENLVLEIVSLDDGIKRRFTVTEDEGQVDYKSNKGHFITTKTKFDIRLSVDELLARDLYQICIRNVHDDELIKFKSSKTKNNNYICYFTRGAFAYALTVQDPGENSPLKIGPAYDNNGFYFRLLDESLKNLWFKIAFMKKEGHSPATCFKALEKFIG